MFTKMVRIIGTLLFTLLFNSVGIAQQAQQQQLPQINEPRYVDSTGFKGKVFAVQQRDPYELARALNPLGSGFKGATIEASREFNTLTVRDFPENIAAIEEALKRLDVAGTAKPLAAIIELRMHVLVASNIEGASNAHPAELGDVLKQLQPTLNFKNYYHLTSIIQRAMEYDHAKRHSGQALTGEGRVQVTSALAGADGRTTDYSYAIQSLTVATPVGGSPTISLDEFRFNIGGAFDKAVINTRLPVRDGEKVVVGTAGLGDKAMILVLSAKVLK